MIEIGKCLQQWRITLGEMFENCHQTKQTKRLQNSFCLSYRFDCKRSIANHSIEILANVAVEQQRAVANVNKDEIHPRERIGRSALGHRLRTEVIRYQSH
jgi:hypothetical protein